LTFNVIIRRPTPSSAVMLAISFAVEKRHVCMVSIGTCLAIHSNVHTVAVGSAIFVSKGTTFLSAVTVASSAKSTSVSTSSAPMDFSAVDVMADLIKLHVNALHVRHYLLYESCREELLRGIY